MPGALWFCIVNPPHMYGFFNSHPHWLEQVDKDSHNNAKGRPTRTLTHEFYQVLVCFEGNSWQSREQISAGTGGFVKVTWKYRNIPVAGRTACSWEQRPEVSVDSGELRNQQSNHEIPPQEYTLSPSTEPLPSTHYTQEYMDYLSYTIRLLCFLDLEASWHFRRNQEARKFFSYLPSLISCVTKKVGGLGMTMCH